MEELKLKRRVSCRNQERTLIAMAVLVGWWWVGGDMQTEWCAYLLRTCRDLASLSSSPVLGLCCRRNKLDTSDVCACCLINLWSKLLLHTTSLPIDLQLLRRRADAKVCRCGTSSANGPWSNCLFIARWSYWQLPPSQPSQPRWNKPGPANCNGLFIISNQTPS